MVIWNPIKNLEAFDVANIRLEITRILGYNITVIIMIASDEKLLQDIYLYEGDNFSDIIFEIHWK